MFLVVVRDGEYMLTVASNTGKLLVLTGQAVGFFPFHLLHRGAHHLFTHTDIDHAVDIITPDTRELTAATVADILHLPYLAADSVLFVTTTRSRQSLRYRTDFTEVDIDERTVIAEQTI